MDHTHRWAVIIETDEQGGRTRAIARLVTQGGDRLVGIAAAPPEPPGGDRPTVRAALAASGALAELARKLHDTAQADIEEAHTRTAEVGP